MGCMQTRSLAFINPFVVAVHSCRSGVTEPGSSLRSVHITLILIKLFIVLILLWYTVSDLYNNNLFIRYSYHTTIRYSSNTSASVHTNNCSWDLYNGDVQTTTVFFTRNFTKGWLNSYCLVVFHTFLGTAFLPNECRLNLVLVHTVRS